MFKLELVNEREKSLILFGRFLKKISNTNKNNNAVESL